MQKKEKIVYVIIPTFNRLDYTRRCVHALSSQTYGSIVVIVSDGGSSDGTPRIIQNEFPETVVLYTQDDLWWGGAMAKGIDWVLKSDATVDDYILMLNDDTEFSPDLIEKLILASNDMNAAVAAMAVDSAEPHRVLDAGTYLDWRCYRYRTKTEMLSGEKFRDDINVMPGRAALVPIYMIEKSGNIDDVRFPHYIADYEFFYRLKKNGFRLAVTYQASIRSHVDMTGVQLRDKKSYTLTEYIKALGSRRSMHNVMDHFRFIMLHGPKGKRLWLVMRVASRMIVNGFRRIYHKHSKKSEALS